MKLNLYFIFFIKRISSFYKVVLFAFVVLISGCAHQVAQFIGMGSPVTKERCQQLDMKKMGFEDGKIGQMPGDKFNFWVKDCRLADVKLDRSLYDIGYQEGMRVYCSCENGFLSGVKDQYIELRGQYYSCSKNEFKKFTLGHAEGKKQSENPEWVIKGPKFEVNYKEDLIQQAAVAACQSIPNPE